jgi:hypothetical protein
MELEQKESQQNWEMKKDILQNTEEQQLRRYGNIMGMEDFRIAGQVAEWNSQGIRMGGGLVNIWKGGIRAKK